MAELIESRPNAPRGLKAWTLAAVAGFYAACLAVATYPAAWTLRTNLPSIVDPLVHLWTMRWYRSCLAEGKLPFLCPEIQFPVGAPLGYLPPMHLQTLMYLALSPSVGNDVLVFNILWIFGFLLTGMGTFLLAWHVLRDRWSACMAGLLAMLSGPMLFWSHSQLEQITFGWFPLFLVAWLRWIDRPTRRGLVAAVVTYLLLSMSAPYFAIFGVLPAAFSATWQAFSGGWRGAWPWLRPRLGWFAAFAALTGPVLVLLFSGQVWAMTHGFPMARSTNEFERYGATFWSYFVPMPQQLFSKVLPNFFPEAVGSSGVSSYLGVVTLFLLYHAFARGARFARSRFWWSMLVLMVVLSIGAYWTVGTYKIGLPGLWLRKYFFAFRPIRVPARFNLFAAICAAVVAAAGLRQLLSTLPNRAWRAVVAVGLMAVAVGDLASVPFQIIPPPALPACYDFVFKRDPTAAVLEAPLCNYGYHLPAACTYWQSTHGGRTSAGYTASPNNRQENLLVENSPFAAALLCLPDYLTGPGWPMIDVVRDVNFDDYAWLYLNHHDFRYVISHHGAGSFPEAPVRMDRIEARMARAKIFEDSSNAVFDATLLARPERPTVLCSEGWRHRIPWRGRFVRIVGPSARLAIYNPEPDRELAVTFEAMAYRKPRRVRLVSNGVDLARWSVDPGDIRTLESPPFRLSGGVQEIEIVSDGAESPSRSKRSLVPGDMTPVSLLVGSVALRPAAPSTGGGGVARVEVSPTAH